jgi:hypothetical protein
MRVGEIRGFQESERITLFSLHCFSVFIKIIYFFSPDVSFQAAEIPPQLAELSCLEMATVRAAPTHADS